MERNYKILFKFPSRSRPEKFFQGLDNIIGNLADKENYLIAVTLDEDDLTMYNRDTLLRLKPYIENHKVFPVFGTSKSKIDAVNRDMDKFQDWDIAVVYSDDMEFKVHGFDNIIRQKFSIHFPDTNGNAHFNDGFVGNRVSTMTIMGKMFFDTYYNKQFYVSEYFSLFCDEEYTLVANKLNKMQYFPEIIFKHNHPANGFGQPDELLKKTEGYWEVDKTTFLRRQAANFYLPIQ